MTLLDTSTTGGIPVETGAAAGSLITQAGQVQYGPIMLGSGSTAGWRSLVNWRSTPDAHLSDSQRPQAHGTYPGGVFGDSLTVTFTYQLRGTPENKALALEAIERYAPMDGVDRPLAVNDGAGVTTYRMARVTARSVPQDVHFRHGPVECSLQFVCADPRRYALTDNSTTVNLPEAVGGLVYPLDYPLDYGTYASGSSVITSSGSVPSPATVVFTGPLTSPTLSAACADGSSWRLGFDITLAAGETLAVDTAAGTAVLNGATDRLYTISTDSDPLEQCTIPPGDTTLTLTAADGSGSAAVTFRDARM